MVCTSSRGKKCPMSYVEKSRQPKCFRNADDDNFNYRYISNKTVKFNRGVTRWWLQDLFAPWFNESFRLNDNGESHCIMIIDGCSAHNGIQ